MDLDEDTEVKSPEPQAEPGERKPEASDRRGLGSAPEPMVCASRWRPRGALRPLSGVLAQEYGGGRCHIMCRGRRGGSGPKLRAENQKYLAI